VPSWPRHLLFLNALSWLNCTLVPYRGGVALIYMLVPRRGRVVLIYMLVPHRGRIVLTHTLVPRRTRVILITLSSF
jgi:hypothetical protein